MSETSAVDMYRELAAQPLVHPGVFSRECFDFEYEPPSHLRRIYHQVYKSFSDDYPAVPQNLAHILPREHGKSVAGSVVVPAWAALRDPSIRILIMSETSSQARRKLGECKDHINRLADDFGRAVKYDNRSQITLERSTSWDVPTVLAAGFNSGVQGGHFDLIVFDDIVSYKTQRTESRRERSWTQFQDYMNLKSGDHTTFLVLGTRKHQDDLYNQLIEGPAWDTTVRSALADFSIIENREFDIVTDRGNIYQGTRLGRMDTTSETAVDAHPYRQTEVLWPDHMSLSDLILDTIRGFGADEGTLVWQREMQNNPRALSGQVLSEDMLQFVSELPGDVDDYMWFAGLDPAVEDDPEKAARNDTDYWGLAIVGHNRIEDETVVTDVFRRRGLSMDAGLRWAKGHLEDNRISQCTVESNQAQRWLVQSGLDMGLSLTESTSGGRKEDRIISMSSRFESGRVKLLEDTDWSSFIYEWTEFPDNEHDDRLDAVELALRAVSDRSVKTVPSTW